MPSHTEQQILPYAPEQLFELVADIERYPDFLPWCRAARVLRVLEQGEGRWPEEMEAELVISFRHLTESYVSRVTLNFPKSIDVVMVRGPFEYLTNSWRFTALEDGQTRIDFTLDFKFRSRILDKLIGPLFGRATDRMVNAFCTRAEVLYG